MKNWNDKERWNLAAKLEGILGADIEFDEEEAIRDAISIVCPEYAKMRESEEAEAVDWMEHATEAELSAFSELDAEKNAAHETYKLRFGGGKGGKP